MKHLLAILLLLAAPCSAAELAGAATAKVGEVVTIAVDGEPAFNTDQTVGENLKTFSAWLASIRFQASGPDNAAATLTTRTTLAITAEGLVPDTVLLFSGDAPGVYVVAALIPPELALHRIQVGPTVPLPPTPPDPPDPPQPPTPSEVTQVTYVYEKDTTAIPPGVSAALQRINGLSILGSIVEQDVVTGDGRVPKQYQIALEAAKREGLPALVVQSGSTVVRVVRNPTTVQAVMEAIGQ